MEDKNSVINLQVRDDYGKLMHLVDGRDAFQSNWLRYVKCCRSLADQNIRAVQYDGNIYYMATKQIEVGEELLAFYGEKFARMLGINVPKRASSKEKGVYFILSVLHLTAANILIFLYL